MEENLKAMIGSIIEIYKKISLKGNADMSMVMKLEGEKGLAFEASMDGRQLEHVLRV